MILALKEGRVFIPPVVVAELLSGKLTPSKRAALEEFIEALWINDSDFFEFSFKHWRDVGMLRAKLARRGISISTPDAHIAQCALDLEGYLLTEDKIFKRIYKLIGLRLAI